MICLGLICHLGICFLIFRICSLSFWFSFPFFFWVNWVDFLYSNLPCSQLPTVWIGQGLSLPLNSTPGFPCLGRALLIPLCIWWRVSAHQRDLIQLCPAPSLHWPATLHSAKAWGTSGRFLSPSVLSHLLICDGCPLGASSVRENWQVGMELFFD